MNYQQSIGLSSKITSILNSQDEPELSKELASHLVQGFPLRHCPPACVENMLTANLGYLKEKGDVESITEYCEYLISQCTHLAGLVK